MAEPRLASDSFDLVAACYRIHVCGHTATQPYRQISAAGTAVHSVQLDLIPSLEKPKTLGDSRQGFFLFMLLLADGENAPPLWGGNESPPRTPAALL